MEQSYPRIQSLPHFLSIAESLVSITYYLQHELIQVGRCIDELPECAPAEMEEEAKDYYHFRFLQK